jgi:D-glycero-alpha-D-manno-heptose-7-phosphate kinase
MVSLEVSGSVRVDLLGGTLDLNPINLILPNVVTLNLATSLKAKVKISTIDFDGVEICSSDYQSTDRFPATDFTPEKLRSGHFRHLTFIAYLLDLFQIHRGVKLELASGSPPGAGLGGSSAMGVTCFSALSQYKNISVNRIEAIAKVNAIESRILDSGPAGYQDYYPALFGGVLGLVPTPGHVEVNQLFTDELKSILEQEITLVYSGETRLSGINNWEVYKAFFNKDLEVRRGLAHIAELSFTAFNDIKNKKYSSIAALIASEGEERRRLFPGILTNAMNEMRLELASDSHHFGMKVCGAGGGGCFLITHKKDDKKSVQDIIKKYQMTELDFIIERPL